MIKTGTKPDLSFRLSYVQNGAQKEGVFSELLTRPTIVSVYMKNNTGSCDKQNQSLAAHAAELDRLGYNLISLSKDTCKSHLAYAGKLGATHVFASDAGDQFAKAMDAIVEKSMYGKKYLGPARAAFVLSKNGKVLHVIEKLNPADHGTELVEAVTSLAL